MSQLPKFDTLPSSPPVGQYTWLPLESGAKLGMLKVYVGHWVNAYNLPITFEDARRAILHQSFVEVFGSDPEAASHYDEWMERHMEADS